MFNVVAVIDDAAKLVERVRYTPYGQARHSWKSDVDGDGDSDSADQSIISSVQNKTIDQAGYDADADINRSGKITLADSALYSAKSALAAGSISDYGAGKPDSSVGYGGYLFNAEGMYYSVRHRSYGPKLGRWFERDPAGSIDGSNRSEYVLSNPVKGHDPSGLKTYIVAFEGWRPFGFGYPYLSQNWKEQVDNVLVSGTYIWNYHSGGEGGANDAFRKFETYLERAGEDNCESIDKLVVLGYSLGAGQSPLLFSTFVANHGYQDIDLGFTADPVPEALHGPNDLIKPTNSQRWVNWYQRTDTSTFLFGLFGVKGHPIINADLNVQIYLGDYGHGEIMTNETAKLHCAKNLAPFNTENLMPLMRTSLFLLLIQPLVMVGACGCAREYMGRASEDRVFLYQSEERSFKAYYLVEIVRVYPGPILPDYHNRIEFYSDESWPRYWAQPASACVPILSLDVEPNPAGESLDLNTRTAGDDWGWIHEFSKDKRGIHWIVSVSPPVLAVTRNPRQQIKIERSVTNSVISSTEFVLGARFITKDDLSHRLAELYYLRESAAVDRVELNDLVTLRQLVEPLNKGATRPPNPWYHILTADDRR